MGKNRSGCGGIAMTGSAEARSADQAWGADALTRFAQLFELVQCSARTGGTLGDVSTGTSACNRRVVFLPKRWLCFFELIANSVYCPKDICWPYFHESVSHDVTHHPGWPSTWANCLATSPLEMQTTKMLKSLYSVRPCSYRLARARGLRRQVDLGSCPIDLFQAQ